MPTNAPYSSSITTNQWLLRETRLVARLRADAASSQEPLDCDAAVARVCGENLFQYPTERKVKRIARACWSRLDALSEDAALRDSLIDLVAYGTLDQARQVNLYVMARENRITWDFLAVFVAHKFRTLDLALSYQEINAFLEGLCAQDERVATWSDATFKKIRQVLGTALEQCEMYDRKAQTLRRVVLDPSLERAIRANGDVDLLPAFGVAGEAAL